MNEEERREYYKYLKQLVLISLVVVFFGLLVYFQNQVCFTSPDKTIHECGKKEYILKKYADYFNNSTSIKNNLISLNWTNKT